jgi:hypothetical protein
MQLDDVGGAAKAQLQNAKMSVNPGQRLQYAASSVLYSRESDALLRVAYATLNASPLESAKYLYVLQAVKEERQNLNLPAPPANCKIAHDFNNDNMGQAGNLVQRAREDVQRTLIAANRVAREAMQELMMDAQSKLAGFVHNNISLSACSQSLIPAQNFALATNDALLALVRILQRPTDADEAERQLDVAKASMERYCDELQNGTGEQPVALAAIMLKTDTIQVLQDHLNTARIGCDGLGFANDTAGYEGVLRDLRGRAFGSELLAKKSARIAQKSNDAALAALHLAQDARIAVPLIEVGRTATHVARMTAEAKQALADGNFNLFNSAHRVVKICSLNVREVANTVIGEATTQAFELLTEKELRNGHRADQFMNLMMEADTIIGCLQDELADAQNMEEIRSISTDFLRDWEDRVRNTNVTEIGDQAQMKMEVLVAFGTIIASVRGNLINIRETEDQTLADACSDLCEIFKIGKPPKGKQALLDVNRIRQLGQIRQDEVTFGLASRCGGFWPSGSVGTLANEVISAVDSALQTLDECSRIIKVPEGRSDTAAPVGWDEMSLPSTIQDATVQVRDDVLRQMADGLSNSSKIVDSLFDHFTMIRTEVNSAKSQTLHRDEPRLATFLHDVYGPVLFSYQRLRFKFLPQRIEHYAKILRQFVDDLEGSLEHTIKAFRALAQAARFALEGFEQASSEQYRIATQNAIRSEKYMESILESQSLTVDFITIYLRLVMDQVPESGRHALWNSQETTNWPRIQRSRRSSLSGPGEEKIQRIVGMQKTFKEKCYLLLAQTRSVHEFVSLVAHASEAVSTSEVKIKSEQLTILKCLTVVHRNLSRYLHSTRYQLQSEGENYQVHGIVASDGWTLGFKKLSTSYLSAKWPYFTRDKHIVQGELLNSDWRNLREGLGTAWFTNKRRTFRIRNLASVQKYAQSPEAENHLVQSGLRPWRYSIYTHTSRMPSNTEGTLEKLSRVVRYNILSSIIPGRTVDGVTAATVSMRLKGQLNLMTTLFLTDPMKVSQEIRDASMGDILGVEATRHLITELFQNRQKASDFPAAATNLLIAYLRPKNTGDYYRRAGDGGKLLDLYTFLTDVQGAESNLELNAVRLAIIHAALMSVAADVQHKDDDHAKTVIAGVSAVASLTAAVAAGSQAYLTPAGANAIAVTANVTRDLVNAKIVQRVKKRRAATTQFIERVRLSLIDTVEQNIRRSFVPGYYCHLSDDDQDTYQQLVLDTFEHVLDATSIPNDSDDRYSAIEGKTSSIKRVRNLFDRLFAKGSAHGKVTSQGAAEAK